MPQAQTLPPQEQSEPGVHRAMHPQPDTKPRHPGNSRLKDKVALITGGDSGIGRATAEAFANEGAHIAIVYHQTDEDAEQTCRLVEAYGRKCLLFKGDVRDTNFCHQAVNQTKQTLGTLNILVNNAGEQHPRAGLEDITPDQLENTFKTNVFGYFYMAQAVLPILGEGDSIINTTSVTAYKGKPELIDYAATKGAITTFTRSLALSLAPKGIRVNGVAPGPIWTPLIPSTFTAEEVAKFGKNTPLERPGQPNEVAPSYVFLASDDASYMTGQVLHPNGGSIING